MIAYFKSKNNLYLQLAEKRDEIEKLRIELDYTKAVIAHQHRDLKVADQALQHWRDLYNSVANEQMMYALRTVETIEKVEKYLNHP